METALLFCFVPRAKYLPLGPVRWGGGGHSNNEGFGFRVLTFGYWVLGFAVRA